MCSAPLYVIVSNAYAAFEMYGYKESGFLDVYPRLSMYMSCDAQASTVRGVQVILETSARLATQDGRTRARDRNQNIHGASAATDAMSQFGLDDRWCAWLIYNVERALWSVCLYMDDAEEAYGDEWWFWSHDWRENFQCTMRHDLTNRAVQFTGERFVVVRSGD
jgi:hypothetical protein